jgi:hypothetical protein
VGFPGFEPVTFCTKIQDANRGASKTRALLLERKTKKNIVNMMFVKIGSDKNYTYYV